MFRFAIPDNPTDRFRSMKTRVLFGSALVAFVASACSKNDTLPSTAAAAASIPSVSVVATVPTTTIGGSSTGLLTFSRSGSTAGDLNVSYMLSGTAVKWNDYYRLPQGDMPVAVTIPTGAASTTLAITAKANTTGANPETAVFTLSPNPSYSIGTANTAVITILAAAPIAPHDKQ